MAKRKSATPVFREKVRRDVELVKARATAVIKIFDNGKIETHFNKNPAIGVIAVIGPGKAYDCHFSEAVLEEIGIGPSRPYHEGRIPLLRQSLGGTKTFPERYKGFSLTRRQYLSVVPLILKIVQGLTDRKSAGRKCNPDNPFYVLGEKWRYDRKEKKTHRWKKMYPCRDGARFSFYLQSLFIPDIFWVEFNSERVKHHLQGLARFIDLRLGHRIKRWRGTREFLKLKCALEIKERIKKSSLSRHLLIEMLEYLPKGRNNQFISHLRQMIGWQGTISPEKEFSLKALSETAVLIGRLEFSVTAGIRNGKDFIVLEIFSSHNWRNFEKAPSNGRVEEDFFF